MSNERKKNIEGHREQKKLRHAVFIVFHRETICDHLAVQPTPPGIPPKEKEEIIRGEGNASR